MAAWKTLVRTADCRTGGKPVCTAQLAWTSGRSYNNMNFHPASVRELPEASVNKSRLDSVRGFGVF